MIVHYEVRDLILSDRITIAVYQLSLNEIEDIKRWFLYGMQIPHPFIKEYAFGREITTKGDIETIKNNILEARSFCVLIGQSYIERGLKLWEAYKLAIRVNI